MFSGAKNKLQQWRQKKKPPKIMGYITKDSVRKITTKATEQLQNLHHECQTVIDQLNQQVTALTEIDEDTTVVREKINFLENQVKVIEKGLEDSKELMAFYDFTVQQSDLISQSTHEIKELKNQVSSLFSENRKLRTQLQIFQDHHERSELKVVELEVQVEHLKFMSSLPKCEPIFGEDEKQEGTDEEEKFSEKPKVVIPFFEDYDSMDCAGSYILSVLDTLDFSDKRLKILFDLIKSYIEEKAYDIAIPLLKTTVEDLVSKNNPQEIIVFSMKEIMAIVFNVTQRFKDAIEVQKEILQIRKETMADEQTGIAQTLSSLAALYGKRGKIKTAINYCRQSLDLKYKVYGEDLETAKELHNMGVLYSYDGKHDKALGCLESARAIMLSTTRKCVYSIARVVLNLASIHILNEEFAEAKIESKMIIKYLNKELDKILEGLAGFPSIIRETPYSTDFCLVNIIFQSNFTVSCSKSKNISKGDILAESDKIENIADCENKFEIKRLVNLESEVQEKLKTLPVVKPNDMKEAVEKYKKKYESNCDED